MPRRGQTVADYFREAQRCVPSLDADLIGLIEHLQNAFKSIGAITAQGVLDCYTGHSVGINVQGEEQKLLDTLTNDIIIGSCEESGTLCGIASEEMEDVYQIPQWFRSGPYLLVCDPLDGSSNIDVNVTIGSIFSVLRVPQGRTEPAAEDFLQPGTQQVAAGYALYGPATMLVLTLGDGVHGFTFNRDIATFSLTHPDMRIPETACEFAINASNQRFWEQPVRRYVTECLQGKTGPRAVDFNMRWIASLVAEVHRILVRGGVYMYPRDSKQPLKAGRLRLLYEANPMAMLVEQAGGAASTGRERILTVEPDSLHQRVPLILGCKAEVDRIVRYHSFFDMGESALEAPLFNVRTLFRTA
jgi:fructose-1,6-bisphosphatase